LRAPAAVLEPLGAEQSQALRAGPPLRASRPSALGEAMPPARSSEPLSGEAFPLSDVQQQVWFLANVEQESGAASNDALLLRIDGPLDVDRLEQAFQRLVGRHEALRTSIDMESGGQIVHPVAWLHFGFEDLSTLPADERSARLQEHVHRECCRPFDLARPPLLRGLVLRTAPEENHLLVTVHDIIVDGHSLKILLGEACELYDCERNGEMWLAEPPLQLSDHVRWEEAFLAGGGARESEAYWMKALRGCPEAIDLPWDFKSPRRRSYAGGRATLMLDGELATAVREHARREKTTVFSVLFATFTLLLHRLSGHDELVVGVRAAARGFQGAAGIVANMSTVLPIVSRIDEQCSAATHQQRIRDAVLGGVSHAAYPFGAILRKLNLRRDPRHAPLASICFNLNSGATPPQLEGLRVQLADLPMRRGRLDLDVNLTFLDDEIRVDAEYRSDLLREETVASWLRAYRRLLTAAVREPQRRALALPLLDPADAAALRELETGPQRGIPTDATLWQLFERSADTHPEALAARQGAHSLDYAGLRQRARRLSAHLRRLGVGPECVVALCMGRSIDMLVSMLAIARCGAGFLALDPAWPERRMDPARRELLFGIAVGVLFGTTSFLLKATTTQVRLTTGSFWITDPATLAALAAEPVTYLFLAGNLASFLLLQLAYANGRVSVVYPLSKILALVCGVVLGFAVLGEDLSASRIAGTLAMLGGMWVLLRSPARLHVGTALAVEPGTSSTGSRYGSTPVRAD
jgi:multidrug transporter EmrE-like cation transporter